MTRPARQLATTLTLLATLAATLTVGLTLTSAAPPPGKGGGNGNGNGNGGGGGNDGGGGSGGGTVFPVTYQIKWLGTLGGEMSVPSGMNNHSEVVGRSDTDRAYSFVLPETGQLIEGVWRHGFLYADLGGGWQMYDLQDVFEAEGLIAPFDYEALEGWYVQQADGINDSGQIIGRMTHIELVDVPGGSQPTSMGWKFFRYTPPGEAPARLEEFTGLEGWQSFSIEAINNFGEVCGHAVGPDNLDHVAVWSQPDAPIDLGLFAAGQDTFGYDINDVGQICGGGNGFRAWRYTPGSGFEDLGVGFKKRYASTAAYSLNNSGQVAGRSSDGQWTARAFRYTDGEGLKHLGTLGGDSSHCNQNSGAINNDGDIVGISQTTTGIHHVFLYTDEHGMADLEAAVVDLPTDLGGQIGDSLQINDARVVCGRAGDGSGTQPSLPGHTYEAFILEPVPSE